jgi:hypothetical protein
MQWVALGCAGIAGVLVLRVFLRQVRQLLLDVHDVLQTAR